MKNLFLLSCICLGVLSCERDKQSINKIPERIANCETFENYTVQVKEGYATYVTYGDDTLAVTTRPITIKIPKQSNIVTRNDASLDIKLNFEKIKENQKNYSAYWQAVMFEDSRMGDYDYNDLIIHVANRTYYNLYGKNYDEQTINIQPIALGSQKIIKLGCVLSDNSTHIISEDVRQDLFGGQKGYINTENNAQPIRYKLDSTTIKKYRISPSTSSARSVAWFIEVDGKRFFAICGDAEYADYDMVNTEGMPYGLVIPSVFNYSKEKTSLFDAYPQFRAWINGEAPNIGKYNDVNLIYTYSIGGIPGKDGKKYKIWDYQDLQ